ncbi:mannan endo-1,6-alpha-mannosidase-like protein [Metarhizium album ARSEF 1941]|uniref:Mannan endo-1,6-alpha-mannosidase n=1 Tax=Metarhizium album (strain ARSEF 1941) TaxID=1081103 RepID=A0A0B2WP90_METAS|nr:mannan endo-1,6-alpha-mannosidase-like protein [Metarhizium album ARSEF 1941]KHN95828.1 mannan endo-1,6-alpha-mannosidase-like protein [Metarhizium album ARSEF 1941]
MKFVKSVQAAAAMGGIFAPKDVDVDSISSVRNVASTLAYETMTYYSGNTTDPKSRDFGNVKKPYYWWVAGALFEALLDYYHYTLDPSYNGVVIQALLAPTNLGPKKDYMPPEHADEEGNDDLFFWGSAVLTAAERNFPQPNPDLPSWLDIGINVFNQLVGRWDTTKCGGGLFWQILESNPNGLKYKNSVSNGGFFQLAARLARATGNSTYLDWAEKIWDWNYQVGFIDSETLQVYDGADIGTDCKKTNKKSFSYTTGIFLYGAAVMHVHTGKPEWKERTEKLFRQGAKIFFTGNDKNIMWEFECEQTNSCNYDMVIFKAILARFMWKTSRITPSLSPDVKSLLVSTVKAAVATCTGGESGRQCGLRWYEGGFSGEPTLGPQLSALELVQGLLVQGSPAPLEAKDIRWNKKADFKPIDIYANNLALSSKREVSTPSSSPDPVTTSSPDNGREPRKSESPAVAVSSWAMLALASASIVAVWGLT